jgi:peptide/nickel transport system substrate-binding protein
MAARRNYWTKFNRRISRRRALQGAAVGGVSLVGASYLACGDDGDGNGAVETGTPPTGNGQPVMGGTLQGTVSLVLGYDPILATTFLTHALASYCYSRLLRYKTTPGALPEDEWYTHETELASEFENPDETTYIFTIHPNATWQNIAPIDPPGRPVTADDIVYAWDLYQANSPNAANLGSVVSSVEAVADNQVQFTLNQPFGLFLNRLASFQDLWIMPRELIETDGDGEQRMVGSGPFILDTSQTDNAVALVYTKNPDYFETDENGNQLPYLDGVTLNVLTDQNQVLTQFAAGNLDTISVPPDLLDQFRTENPNAIVDVARRNILSFFYFEPATYTEGNTPFSNVDVRRAMSMTLNRDQLLDVASPEGGEWPNIINAGMGSRWWFDPRSDEMGDAAQWYEFNLERARELLGGAGFADGFDVNMYFSSSVYTTIVPYYDLVRSVLRSVLGQVGIRVSEVPQEYGEYITTTFVDGPPSGFAWGLESVFTDVGMYLANMFRPKDQGGGRNHSSVDDPELVSMIEDMLRETDLDVLNEKNYEIQRYVSDMMYYIPVVTPNEAGARQPWVKNAPNTTGPTTYAVGTEGALKIWKEQ